MRKIFFMIVLAFVLVVPGAFLFTACGSNNAPSQKEITGLNIKKGESVSNEHWITLSYGDTIADITDGVSLVFRYSDGSEKEFSEQNFSEEEFQRIRDTYKENYYVANSYDEVSGQPIYNVYTGETHQNTKLDVGKYKVEISLSEKTATLYVDVMQTQIKSKNVAVVILQNENNNYQSKINAIQTYKYGMPTAQKEYHEEQYTSDYKLYVLDKDKNNQIISGTDVKEVKALPETYDGFTTCDAFPNIEIGTNMVEYYNSISEETAEATLDKKQTFLGSFGINITNGYTYSNADNALIVNTEALKPGNYFVYVLYQNKNHYDFYTEPVTQLNIEKGVFDLKKAIRYNDQDWSEANAKEILSKVVVSVNYTFDTKNPLFNGKGTKALTAKYLNDNHFVISNAHSSSEGEVFENVNFEIAGGGYTGFYGEFKLLEKNNNQDIRFDATTGSTDAKAIFVLNDDWVYEYYEDDQTIYDVDDIEIQVNINKGQVHRPYCATSDTLEREYTGETISIVGDDGIFVADPEVITFTGNISATAINTYTATYSLIDDVNYEFVNESEGMNYGDNGTFTWKITKIDLNGQWGEGFTTQTIGYNGTDYPSYDAITYVDGVRTFTVTLSGNEKYNLLLTKLPGRHIDWSINTEQTINVVGAQVSQETGSDVATVTFTGLVDGTDYGYIHLEYSIAETAYSKELHVENGVQIIINKKNFSKAEEAKILAAIGAEKSENDMLRLDHKIVISKVYMNLPNVLPDYSHQENLPETAVYGTWKLYSPDDGQYLERHNGDHLSSADLIGWMFKFIPADNMYNGYEVFVDFIEDVEFVNEDIPEDVLNSLKSEVDFNSTENGYQAIGTYSTITDVWANSAGYGLYSDVLPVHNNDAEGAFKGRWVLCFDAPNGDYDIELVNGELRSYESGAFDENYIKSSDRNWRIKFIPENTAYNALEISVNVTFE